MKSLCVFVLCGLVCCARSPVRVCACSLKKSKPFEVMTYSLCMEYDKLREDIVTLINLQKFVQKREQELAQLRAQKGL
jgi:hypothetical protein